jgi:hypothetical protein
VSPFGGQLSQYDLPSKVELTPFPCLPYPVRPPPAQQSKDQLFGSKRGRERRADLCLLRRGILGRHQDYAQVRTHPARALSVPVFPSARADVAVMFLSLGSSTFSNPKNSREGS